MNRTEPPGRKYLINVNIRDKFKFCINTPKFKNRHVILLQKNIARGV